jgi:type III pantothenate kinase
MILAIDIGNSFVKCAVLDESRVLGREAVATKLRDGTDQIYNLVRRVSGTVLTLEAAIISSVVPALTEGVIRAVQNHAGIEATVVDCHDRFPFELGVASPESVGTDRLCAAAGAVGLKRRSAIVIDAGSAITVDVVRNGVFLGGIIGAGPSIALRALHDHASQLPLIDLSGEVTVFSKSYDTTRAAMTLGASVGSVGAIREAVRYLEASIGAKPQKYVTGGFGQLLSTRLPRSWKVDPDLTLRGLYIISTLNPDQS